MPSDEELRKFKEMLHDSINDTFRKFELQQAHIEKKQNMIRRFKSAMWR
jgi:hypothetical protein